jgi:hypothetical protein
MITLQQLTAYCKRTGFNSDTSFGQQHHGSSWNALFQRLECVSHPDNSKQSHADASESAPPSFGECDVIADSDRTVVGFMRDEWRSYFHTLGDLIRLFAVLHKYNALPSFDPATANASRTDVRSHVQLLLFDTFPSGPFWPLWEAFTSLPAIRPLTGATEPEETRIDTQTYTNRRVCFPSLLLSFPCRSIGGGWDRANIYSAHPCPGTPMFLDFKRFIVNHFANKTRHQPLMVPFTEAAAAKVGTVTDVQKLPLDPIIQSDHRTWHEIGALPELHFVIAPAGMEIRNELHAGVEPIQIVLIHRPKRYGMGG